MNILSYQSPAIFTGRQIKQWAYDTINSRDKQKIRMALRVLSHYSSIADDRRYQVEIARRSDTGSSLKNQRTIFIRTIPV